jgi:hypothetical protein
MKKLHAGQNAKNVFWPGGKFCLQVYESAEYAFRLTGEIMHT